MEDTPLPDFFDSQAKPAETAAPESAPKKKRTPRAQPAGEAPTAPPPAAPKPERQKRGPNKKPRQARSAKIELSVAFHALTGLSLDEARIMASITSGLQQVPRKSRGRVVAALAKLFT